MTDPRRGLGAAGEQRVAEWYEAQGYRVLDRNWRHGRGELDLVVQAPDGTVVFCEVKTRSTARFGSGLEGITPAKVAQVRRLAAAWLRQRGSGGTQVRFDAASVTGGQLDVLSDAF